jgi:hypothetical protein
MREAGVQLVGHRAAEHAVAEEFQPFVVVRALAAVRQRPLEQAGVRERVAEKLYWKPFAQLPLELAA